MKDLELNGQWWLPNEPENKVTGTVTFSNRDGISLKFVGAFFGPSIDHNYVSFPVVLGLTDKGKVTLQGCSFFGGWSSYLDHIDSDGSPKYLTLPQQYGRAQAIYIGVHFTDPDQIKFTKMSIDYSHLAVWLGLFVMPSFNEVEDQSGTIEQYTLAFNYPRVTAITDRVTISFLAGLDKYQPIVSMSAEVAAGLKIEEWLSQIIQPIQNLISLGLGRPVFLLQLSGYSEQDIDAQSLIHERKIPHIKIMLQTSYYETEQIVSEISNADIIFSLHSIKDNFSEVLQRWFTITSELDSVYDLFFSNRYSYRISLKQSFLNQAQAVESYHRRRFNNQVLSEEEHTKRLETILANVPEDCKTWLKGKLTYSNEPNLRQRLKELVRKLSNETSFLFSTAKNRDKFINKVVDTRNYFTHYDYSLQDRAAKGSELYAMVRILNLILHILLMKELGIRTGNYIELFRYGYDATIFNPDLKGRTENIEQ
jgi:hypothetical protein